MKQDSEALQDKYRELYDRCTSRFWLLRRSEKITNTQADLYHFLLHECHVRQWKTEFLCANEIICASIGINEARLIEARNRLKQLGLIYFTTGGKKEFASYTIKIAEEWV